MTIVNTIAALFRMRISVTSSAAKMPFRKPNAKVIQRPMDVENVLTRVIKVRAA